VSRGVVVLEGVPVGVEVTVIRRVVRGVGDETVGRDEHAQLRS
jgi:hypothetical protein